VLGKLAKSGVKDVLKRAAAVPAAVTQQIQALTAYDTSASMARIAATSKGP
jgi:hypothetical protein